MKRLVFLYTLLLVAPLHGAELVRPSAPVQLSFSFAAPVAMMPLTALTPALPMPLPTAAVLPMAAPVLVAPLPASVSPSSKEDDRTDGRSQLQSLARNADAPGKSFDTPKRKTKMDYDEFGRQVAAAPSLDLNAFRHTDAKRRILAASGYTHLYGAGGVRIPLAKANDVRVGNAFLSVKKTFDRRPR